MTFPIIAGHSISAKTKIVQLEGAQAKFRQQVAWKLLGSDLFAISGDISETRARIAAQTIVRKTALENYNKIIYRYEHGQSTRPDLTDSEHTATFAESNLIEAKYKLNS